MKLVGNRYILTETRFDSKSAWYDDCKTRGGQFMDMPSECPSCFLSIEVYDTAAGTSQLSAIALDAYKKTFYIDGKTLLLIADRYVFAFEEAWKKKEEFVLPANTVICRPNGKVLVLCETDVYFLDERGTLLAKRPGEDVIMDYRYADDKIELFTDTGRFEVVFDTVTGII